MRFIKSTAFWENIKKSITVFAAPSMVGLHELGAADHWMIIAGTFSFAGALLAIWMVDNDKDGIVDLFQEKT